MGQSNRTRSLTQQALPTFENVLAFPHQHVDEPWTDYVARVQSWDRERTEAAQRSGAYRAIPYVPGLTDPAHRGLFVTLAWHSWSEGLGRYAPIRLSERCVAALMGDTSSHAKGRAGTAMKALIGAGALEVLEEARGRRARLVCVAGLCPTTDTKNGSKKGASTGPHNKREDTESNQHPPKAPSRSGIDPVADEVAQRVVRRFGGDITRSTVLGWIAQTSAENVAQQLEWFSQRDVSGFRNGPAAAFGHFCKTEAPAPEPVRNREAMERWKARCEENVERIRREELDFEQRRLQGRSRADRAYDPVERDLDLMLGPDWRGEQDGR